MTKFKGFKFVDVISYINNLSFDGVVLKYGEGRSVAYTSNVEALVKRGFLSLVSKIPVEDVVPKLVLEDDFDLIVDDVVEDEVI